MKKTKWQIEAEYVLEEIMQRRRWAVEDRDLLAFYLQKLVEKEIKNEGIKPI